MQTFLNTVQNHSTAAHKHILSSSAICYVLLVVQSELILQTPESLVVSH